MPKKIILFLSIFLIILLLIFAIFKLINNNKILPENGNIANVLNVNKPDTDQKSEALPIKTVFLSVDKNIYKANEDVWVTYVVMNSSNVKKNWRVVYNFSSEDKEVALVGQEELITVEKGEEGRVSFSTKVDENFSPGYYMVTVNLFENDEKINSKTEMIKIEGTKRKINANIMVCSDKNCNEEKYVYLLDEPIFINYDSETEGLEVVGKIKDTDNNWSDLNFIQNVAEISIDKIGSYEINLVLTKNDYQEKIINKGFSVIETLPVIKNESKCLADGKCENEETKQNCPQDCY